MNARKITREEAAEFARVFATRRDDVPFHEYQPTPEQARNWEPHEWVVDLLMAAVNEGLPALKLGR